MTDQPAPPDTLNEIGVLRRREIEARILKPFVEALAAEFGRERVVEILRSVVVDVARQQGAQVALQTGGKTLEQFGLVREQWQRGGALEIETLEESPERLAFNVTRCRYAELYRALGIAELGAVLSCNRDFALIQGFNPDIRLTRTQTLMEGAAFCDFRYQHYDASRRGAAASDAKPED